MYAFHLILPTSCVITVYDFAVFMSLVSHGCSTFFCTCFEFRFKLSVLDELAVYVFLAYWSLPSSYSLLDTALCVLPMGVQALL